MTSINGSTALNSASSLRATCFWSIKSCVSLSVTSTLSWSASLITLKTQRAMVEIRVYGIPRPQGSLAPCRQGDHGGGQQTRRPVAQRRYVCCSCRPPWGTNDRAGGAGDVFHPRPVAVGTGRNADSFKPSAPAHCTSRAHGDTSKLIRSDAISASSGYPVIEDDSQVVRLSCEKRYVTETEACGALIRVTESQHDSNRSRADLRLTLALVCR